MRTSMTPEFQPNRLSKSERVSRHSKNERNAKMLGGSPPIPFMFRVRIIHRIDFGDYPEQRLTRAWRNDGSKSKSAIIRTGLIARLRVRSCWQLYAEAFRVGDRGLRAGCLPCKSE